jgi:hypothetical protein
MKSLADLQIANDYDSIGLVNKLNYRSWMSADIQVNGKIVGSVVLKPLSQTTLAMCAAASGQSQPPVTGWVYDRPPSKFEMVWAGSLQGVQVPLCLTEGHLIEEIWSMTRTDIDRSCPF